MAHLLETFSKYKALLKVFSQCLCINEVAAEMKCFIHLLFVVNEIDYTREHAEIINDFLSLMVSCGTYTYKGYPTVFESTSKTSFMKLDSANCFHQLAENPISTCKHRGAGDDLKGKGEKKGNLNCIEDMGKSNIGRQPEIKREEYAWDNSEENKTKGQNERNEIKRRLS